MQLEERTQHRLPPTRNRNFGLAAAIGRLLGGDPPIGIECYDGSRIGPDDSASKLVVRSPLALRYVLTAPGELGFARAYVSGELDAEGDIFEVLKLRDHLPDVKLGASKITILEDFESALRTHKPGDKVKATIRRGTELIELEVTLGRRRMQ